MQAATARCTPQQQWQLAELASIQLDDCCRQLHILPQPAQADGQQQPRHQTLGSPSVFPQHGGTAQQQAQQQQHHFHYQPEQQQQHEHALTALHPVDQQHQLVEQSSMMAAATVAGLWPEVLQQAGHVLECLLCLALGLRCTEAQQAAMVAAAAVLNKWPTGQACGNTARKGLCLGVKGLIGKGVVQ